MYVLQNIGFPKKVATMVVYVSEIKVAYKRHVKYVLINLLLILSLKLYFHDYAGQSLHCSLIFRAKSALLHKSDKKIIVAP